MQQLLALNYALARTGILGDKGIKASSAFSRRSSSVIEVLPSNGAMPLPIAFGRV